MAGNANNILISPANVYWKIESNSQFDLSGLTGADVKGKYFTMSSPSVDHYVWFDDSIEADPAPVGLTAIAVTVAGDSDSDTTLATALQTAMDAEGDFTATVSSTVVDVKAVAVGEVTDPVDVDSGVLVTVCRRGKNFDLGLLDGDSELPLEPQIFPVRAQQSGATDIAALITGYAAAPSLVLQETTRSKLSEIYSIYGGKYTPLGGTEITGVGTGTVGKNLLVDAARLEFAPVNDFSEELTYKIVYALASPVPESLVFSGENPRVLNLSFNCYVDQSLDPRNNFLIVGDAFQTGI